MTVPQRDDNYNKKKIPALQTTKMYFLWKVEMILRNEISVSRLSYYQHVNINRKRNMLLPALLEFLL